MEKFGYGLEIFGILGVICIFNTELSENLQFFVFPVFCIILGIYFVLKSNNQKSKTKIDNKKSDVKIDNTKFEFKNNINFTEGIVYPLHIKCKDDKNRVYWNGFNNVKQQVYNCIFDNKIVATISGGQETELKVTQGEHTVYFQYTQRRNNAEWNSKQMN